MTKYFYKELVFNQVYDRHGNAVQFEQIGHSSGLLELDSDTRPDLVSDLQKMAGERVGGVVELTKGEYDKKKAAAPILTAFAQPSPHMVKALPSRSDPINGLNANAAEVKPGPPPAPILPTEAAPVVLPPTAPVRRGRLGKKAEPVAA